MAVAVPVDSIGDRSTSAGPENAAPLGSAGRWPLGGARGLQQKKEKMSSQKCQFTSFGDLSENDVGQSQNQYPGRRLHDASRCHLIALWLARFNGPLTTTVALDDRPAEESHQLKL